jgi:primosomal replication protein N
VSIAAPNSVTLAGEITAIEPMRHTPAGLPLLNLRLTHRSVQAEAGIQRQTEFEVGAVAIGDIAVAASKFQMGDTVTVQGFLAARRRMGAQIGTQLTLHLTQITQFTQT